LSSCRSLSIQRNCGPKEDLARYPRPFENDVKLCEAQGVDLVFHPSPDIMYASSFQTFVEVTELQKVLCGATRPGHFRGVATVVLKLFNIVTPDIAYFGQRTPNKRGSLCRWLATSRCAGAIEDLPDSPRIRWSGPEFAATFS